MVFVRVSLNFPITRFDYGVEISDAKGEICRVDGLKTIGCSKFGRAANLFFAHSDPVGHVEW